MLALLWKPGVVDDPGYHRSVLLHSRHYLLAPARAIPRHSMELWPPNDAETVASAPRSQDPDAQPSARCSCVHPAAAVPCSSSAGACADPHALRLSPGHPYMPQSASPVGLARRGVMPQNNSTSKCTFMTQ